MNVTNEAYAITRRINEREDVIQSMRHTTADRLNELYREVLLQGQDLLKLEVAVPEWNLDQYLAAKAPKVDLMHAKGYMRLARNPTRIEDPSQLLLPMFAVARATNEHFQPRPAWTAAVSRFGTWLRLIKLTPLSNWPDEGRNKLKAQVEPIARQLWPERWG